MLFLARLLLWRPNSMFGSALMTTTTSRSRHASLYTRISGLVAGWRSKLKIRWTAAALAAALMFAAGGTSAKGLAGNAEIDQTVISKLSSLYGINSKVVTHVDLTKPFDTKSQWTLVIAKQPDEESSAQDGVGSATGVISVCFVENADPDCSEAMFLAKYREWKMTFAPGERPFYEFFAGEVVYLGPGKTLPLLRIKTCTMPGANGNCGVSTFLFAYDRDADRFRVIFFNITGRNNNQETRFVESGPLLGNVIVAYPTNNVPFTYYVEVHKQNAAGEYARVLKYRGKTGYGDGNPLAVIDSEMPEILRRLGLWKTGDVLPIPPTMPAGCTRLVMRKSVEWCEPSNSAEPSLKRQHGSR